MNKLAQTSGMFPTLSRRTFLNRALAFGGAMAGGVASGCGGGGHGEGNHSDEGPVQSYRLQRYPNLEENEFFPSGEMLDDAGNVYFESAYFGYHSLVRQTIAGSASVAAERTSGSTISRNGNIVSIFQDRRDKITERLVRSVRGKTQTILDTAQRNDNWFPNAPTINGKGDVAFIGFVFGQSSALYVSHNGESPTKVIDFSYASFALPTLAAIGEDGSLGAFGDGQIALLRNGSVFQTGEFEGKRFQQAALGGFDRAGALIFHSDFIDNTRLLFAYREGTLEPIAREAFVAPFAASVNDRGEIAVLDGLASAMRGVYLWSAGRVIPVVRTGDLVDGVRVDRISLGNRSLNNKSQIALSITGVRDGADYVGHVLAIPERA